MSVIEISGKKVVLREGVAVEKHENLLRQINGLASEAGWQARAEVLSQFVESWEFDGDPKSVEAWGDVDVFDMNLIDRALSDVEPKIVFRQRFPAREYDDITDDARRLFSEKLGWTEAAQIMLRFAESWEYEGDAHNVKSWGKLDIWVFVNFELAISRFIRERANRSKNLAIRSTTG